MTSNGEYGCSTRMAMIFDRVIREIMGKRKMFGIGKTAKSHKKSADKIKES
ncbi:hypothetical protein [Athalassotoga sp.]|uniref:hypothetical protein n=1 Tax=Athalassotoga sp. TaxID=2022597 RepID=UPI003D06B8C4